MGVGAQGPHTLSLLTLHVLFELHMYSLVHNLKEHILAINPPQSSLAGKKRARVPARTEPARGAHMELCDSKVGTRGFAAL